MKCPNWHIEFSETPVFTCDYVLEDRRGVGGKTPVILYGGFRANGMTSAKCKNSHLTINLHNIIPYCSFAPASKPSLPQMNERATNAFRSDIAALPRKASQDRTERTREPNKQQDKGWRVEWSAGGNAAPLAFWGLQAAAKRRRAVAPAEGFLPPAEGFLPMLSDFGRGTSPKTREQGQKDRERGQKDREQGQRSEPKRGRMQAPEGKGRGIGHDCMKAKRRRLKRKKNRGGTTSLFFALEPSRVALMQ